ncbi:hypothetical protein J2Q11_03400 [Tenacibaculum finnmarkense genomovar finnmarkense]|uniref:hypothetical protein n=1 Tax=Tenacibaculum finnmarkense TaxID=2781243 RepID=UPI00187B4773|nr:hypothetical protein [Tenacibaculum finnmarkense]MBE7659245.1 hypothetical protein [Tenacibaculum finnmarkense genomovar finnmarkense]MCD8418058.1 hypothetical protein [Tenacibaculum finnmarkense genomovar finnmarkense]MCG8185117.1 hypothetical protein [Tenacibaculum finnmarkense genomovar finnmarkense]MCG8201050.1 hypothetical protein [Tenacibaculum finnmarkense genomovar finnmarkense]MCG8209076.1 hypothetical protein [Tenacibaculum finnmarkense genomovar finnmarkense]
MFNVVKNNDEKSENIKKNKIETLYINFEKKLKELVKWELDELIKTKKEISFRVKDRTEEDGIKIGIYHFNKWKDKITEKEIELDYWYFERITELNENCHKKDYLKQNLKVEGRFLNLVTGLINQDNELLGKINGIKKKMNKQIEILSNTLDAVSLALMLAPEPTGVTKVASYGVEALSVFIVSTNSALDSYFEDIEEELRNNFSKYYIQGFLVNEKIENLEILESRKNR